MQGDTNWNSVEESRAAHFRAELADLAISFGTMTLFPGLADVDSRPWDIFAVLMTLRPAKTIENLRSMAMTVKLIPSWAGHAVRPTVSWALFPLQGINIQAYISARWAIPCRCLDPYMEAAFAALLWRRHVEPAWRLSGAERLFPVLSYLRERPERCVIRRLAEFAAKADQARVESELLVFCGYLDHPQPGEVLPAADVLASPWLRPKERSMLLARYYNAAKLASYRDCLFLPVYSADIVRMLLRSTSHKLPRSASFHGPWVVDEPEKLVSVLPFVTDSPLYAAACAAVKHAPLIDSLRSMLPETPFHIPLITTARP